MGKGVPSSIEWPIGRCRDRSQKPNQELFAVVVMCGMVKCHLVTLTPTKTSAAILSSTRIVTAVTEANSSARSLPDHTHRTVSASRNQICLCNI